MNRAEALATLGLEESAEPSAVQSRYETLRAKLNPLHFEELPSEFKLLAETKLADLACAFACLHEPAQVVEPEIVIVDPRKILAKDIASLGLTVRTYNSLRRSGRLTIRDVLAKSASLLMQIHGFGAGCLVDLMEKLHGLIGPDSTLHEYLEAFERSAEDSSLHKPLPAAWLIAEPVEPAQPAELPVLVEKAFDPGSFVADLSTVVDDRTATVLIHRFGLDGQPDWTLQLLADRISGLTRERIRQIQERGLRDLSRSHLGKGLLKSLEATLLLHNGWVRVADLDPAFIDLGVATTGLLRLAADMDESLHYIVPLQVLCSSPRTDSLWTQAKIAAMRQFKAPVPISLVAEWLTDQETQETPERLRWVIQHFWGCSTSEVEGVEMLLCFEGSPTLADRAAGILALSGPLNVEELWDRFSSIFPDGPGTSSSIDNAIANDPRFFLIDSGTWTLRRLVTLEADVWEAWVTRILQRLWEVGEVTNTRLLLDMLQDEFRSLPPWLNEHSLYWLVRQDPRFETHRRLEVQPADAEWDRKGLSQIIEDVLSAATRPLTLEEILEQLSARRPYPAVSVSVVLAKGREAGKFIQAADHSWTLAGNEGLSLIANLVRLLDDRGQPAPGREIYNEVKSLGVERSAFYEVIDESDELLRYPIDPIQNWVGLTKWGMEGWKQAVSKSWKTVLRNRAAMPPEALKAILLIESGSSVTPELTREPKELWEWENFLRDKLSKLKLVGQLDLTSEQTATLLKGLKQQFLTGYFGEALERVASRFPCCLVTGLVFQAVHHYESNCYWPKLCAGLGIAYSNSTSDLGRAFEKILRRLDLPAFDQVEGARYLRKIVGHAGIPANEVAEFFDVVVIPSVQEDFLVPLTAGELLDLMAQAELYTTQAVRWFVQCGGRFAEDIVERCRDLARESLRLNRVSEEDFGLPERLAAGLEAWFLKESKETKSSSGKALLPRPSLCLQPWAEGLGVQFPSARLGWEGSARIVRVRWEIDDGLDSAVAEDTLSVHGGQMYLPDRFFALQRPAREYRCCIIIDESKVVSCAVPGFDRSRPLRFFTPRTGLAMGQRIPDRAVWLVCPNTRLTLDGQPPDILEEFPELVGEWSGYRSCWLELRGRKQIELDQPAYRLAVTAEIPLKLSGESLEQEEGEFGLSIFLGQLPSLDAELGDPRAWQLQIFTEGVSVSLTGTELSNYWSEGQLHLPLAELMPQAQPGEYRIVLRGQLGQDSRRVFRFVPRLKVFRSNVAETRGTLMLQVPAGVQLWQGVRQEQPHQIQPGDWIFKLGRMPGAIRLSGTLHYPRKGGSPYSLTLSLPPTEPLWALVGIAGASDINWVDEILNLPMEALEESPQPALLVYSPEECWAGLVLPGSDGNPKYAAELKVLNADNRGRLRLPLRPLLDTIRAESRTRLPLHLRLGPRQFPVLQVCREWQVGHLTGAFDAGVVDDYVQLSLAWSESFATAERRARAWPLTRPWESPRDVILDCGCQVTLRLAKSDYPPGLYLVELYAYDGWLSYTLEAQMPDRKSPNCVACWCQQEQASLLSASPGESGLECLERYLIDFERGENGHKALFPLRQVLQPDDVRTVISAMITVPKSSEDMRVAVDQYLVEALKDRLSDVLRALPQLATRTSRAPLLELAMQMGLTGYGPAHTIPFPASEDREALWSFFAPMGLFVELGSGESASARRCERFLGQSWENLRGHLSLPEWGQTPGPEAGMSDRQLGELWHYLGVTPTALLDPENLQRCFFQTFRSLHRFGLRQEAERFVELEGLRVESELKRLQEHGLQPSTLVALWKRHPLPLRGGVARGDFSDPVVRLPFVVGGVAFLQRFAAHENVWPLSYPRPELRNQTLMCFRLAPDLLERDLCHAELALAPNNATLEAE